MTLADAATRIPAALLATVLALGLIAPTGALAASGTVVRKVAPAQAPEAPAAASSPATPDPARLENGLPLRVSAALRSQGIPRSAISLVVRDAATGDSLLEVNPEIARSPASTMKVLSAYAALDLLGPNYTWVTRAYAAGPLANGRLQGDLVLQGGGDPLLSIERWWGFVQALRARGVERIDGDIVIDNTYFAPSEADPDDFDGRGFKTYNVLPDALLVNHQAVEVTIAPGQDRARVVLNPAPANLTIKNLIRLTNTKCRSGASMVRFGGKGDGYTQLTVSGPLSRRCGPTRFYRAVQRAPEFAYGTFVSLWRQSGGQFSGAMRLAAKPATAKLLLEYDSPTLSEAVHSLLKHSNNPMTRTLVLTMGAERFGTPATVPNGEQVIHDWLVERGLIFPELVIDNGSGLSRITRISADSMAQLLVDAWRSPYAAEFQAGLPLGGMDGTLRNRFREVDGGRVRMKTGTLNSVSALAGYVRTQSGKPLVVVAMINHPGAQGGSGSAISDALVRWALQLP